MVDQTNVVPASENHLDMEAITEALVGGDGSSDLAATAPDDLFQEPNADDLALLDEQAKADLPAPGPRASELGSEEAHGRLWDMLRKNNKDLSTMEFSEIEMVLQEMAENEKEKQLTSFAQVDVMRRFLDLDIHTKAQMSFREFFNHPDRPIDKSSAYRYRSVAELAEIFPIDDPSFYMDFYERWGVSMELIFDSTGKIDQKATNEHNAFTRRARFTDTARVASLLNSNKIATEQAEELLSKSLMLTSTDFDAEIKKITGNNKDTVTEMLRERQIFGTVAVVPLWDKIKGPVKLRELADRIEKGENFVQPVQEEEAELLGSKSIKFYELPDGQSTVIAVV